MIPECSVNSLYRPLVTIPEVLDKVIDLIKDLVDIKV